MRKIRLRHWLVGLVPTLLLIVVLGYTKYLHIAQAIAQSVNFKPPPDAVSTLVVSSTKWQPTFDVIGSLSPVQGVTLSAEESGRITKINFVSGQQVHKGDLLISLDTSVEEAQLAAAQARAELATVTRARTTRLRQQDAMSEASLNDATAQLKAAEADVKALQATITRKQIIAPFDGTVGIRLVNEGQYVSPGTALVPLQSLASLYLTFTVPQQMLRSVQTGNVVQFSVDTYPAQEFSGAVNAIDPEIIESSRSVKIQATVGNADGRLRPGMFAKVSVPSGALGEVVAVPTAAINYAPYGNTVFVVEEKREAGKDPVFIVHPKRVELGAVRGDQVGVVSGLTPGDRIVTSGVFRLRPEGQVTITDTIQPSNNPRPTPADT